MSNKQDFQQPSTSIWTDAKRKKTSGSEGLIDHHSVVDGPEELTLPDVSTLINDKPVDASNRVEQGQPSPPKSKASPQPGLFAKENNSGRQNTQGFETPDVLTRSPSLDSATKPEITEGEAAMPVSAPNKATATAFTDKAEQFDKAGHPDVQTAANKQTGVVEGATLLYIAFVFVSGVVTGYVGAWLMDDQVVVQARRSESDPWTPTNTMSAQDYYTALLNGNLADELVSRYSGQISAIMTGSSQQPLGGFDLGEEALPESNVTPRIEIGDTIFSTPLTDAELLERITTPTQQPDAQDFVLRIGIGYELGVPSHWPESVSRDGKGIRYINPDNMHDRVRMAPGDPSSDNPGQRVPYATRQADGKFFDRDGNEVSRQSEESHIPLEDFEFIERRNLRRQSK